jgi:ubiquinone/menaquinone biosynthesis C-methylase UbiE
VVGVDDAEEAIREIARVLEAGGRLFLHVRAIRP